MSAGRKTVGLLRAVGYLIGGALLLLAAMAVSYGEKRLYLVVGLAASGLLIIVGSFTFLGNRRILPVAVTRHGEAVVCRYIPWFELNNYTLFIVIPLIGVVALAAPGWMFGGVIVLGAVAWAGYAVFRMWRRCLLVISPDAVTVQLPARGSQATTIPRSRIQSISAADAEMGAAFAPVTVSQVAIAYQAAAPSAGTSTVLVGPPAGKTALQVSVQPTNLYYALLAWKDGNPGDPTLMDRVEASLRGQARPSA